TLRRGQGLAAGEQTRDQIAHAEDQLGRTLEELRRLAQGLHPRVLAEHGLADALAALAKDLLLPVEIKVTGQRLPPRGRGPPLFVFPRASPHPPKPAPRPPRARALTASDGRLRVEITDD